MEYFQISKTDLKASRLALGCMRIADKSLDQVEELVQTALDAGINFFDRIGASISFNDSVNSISRFDIIGLLITFSFIIILVIAGCINSETVK